MKPEAKQIYRHFKGTLYFVEGFAKHSETLEDLVLYRKEGSCKCDEVWARPLNMWFDYIERDEYSGPRFIKHTDV
ncbi:MAG: DUF1653 domain-containing protein [Candidatus Ranarchaeia archaeon]